MIELLISSPDELDQVVVPKLLEFAGERRLVALYGEIGTGKTTLVQALCRHLGVTDTVSSPTFALVHEYTLPAGGRNEPIYHLDLYRLRDLREAQDIGLEEYLDQPDAWCLIEWPELIEDWLPADTVRVKLEVLPESGRKIVLL